MTSYLYCVLRSNNEKINKKRESNQQEKKKINWESNSEKKSNRERIVKEWYGERDMDHNKILKGER